MKEWLTIIGQGTFYVSLFGLYALGVYHSYDKHNDADALIWSPFAIYRGAEFFFHDNSKEWKAEIRNVAYFLESWTNNNPPTFNSEFTEFKKRFNDFSDEGKKYLKEFAQCLLKYRRAYSVDFKNSIMALKLGEEFWFNPSSNTTVLKSKLQVYDLKNQLEFEDKQIAEIVEAFNRKLENATYGELEDLKNYYEIFINSQSEMYDLAYNEIFN